MAVVASRSAHVVGAELAGCVLAQARQPGPTRRGGPSHRRRVAPRATSCTVGFHVLHEVVRGIAPHSGLGAVWLQQMTELAVVVPAGSCTISERRS